MTLLRHLAMRCRDMERSRDFYQTALGFQFVGYRPEGDSLDFSDGTNNITLLQYQGQMNRPVLEEGSEYIHFGIVVTDLEACWRRCRDWGATISRGDVKDRTEIDQQTIPVRSFKVLDPDHNVIDVTADQNEWRGIKT